MELVTLLWFVIIIMGIIFAIWVYVSGSKYSWTLLHPGETYMIQGRRYTFPNLECEGPTYCLTEAHISELRKLLLLTGQLLDSLKMIWTLSGGSLIGVYRGGVLPLPFDDDIDMWVNDEHRKFLFSEKFVQAASAVGLQIIYLRGASSKRANRTGACVRVQIPGCFGTLDIFFWTMVTSLGRFCKLDGWDGPTLICNEKERFQYKDVFPIQRNILVDDMYVNLPCNPRNVLVQQYGEGVFTKIVARSCYVSHLFAFQTLRGMWTKTAPG